MCVHLDQNKEQRQFIVCDIFSISHAKDSMECKCLYAKLDNKVNTFRISFNLHVCRAFFLFFRQSFGKIV